MAIETPPSLTPPPAVPDDTIYQGDAFNTVADNWLDWQVLWNTELGALSLNVENNATEAENFATASSGYSDDSATSASESLSYRNEAQTAANTAVSSVASLPDGLIDTNDDFSDITNTWNKGRIALETNSAPYKPVIDLDFARDTYKSYVGLAAGWQTAPLLDLATFSRVGDATGVNAFGNVETVGTDQPRVVFENGVAKGILLEGGGENLALYSEDFTNAAWTKRFNTTITSKTDTTCPYSDTVFQLDSSDDGSTYIVSTTSTTASSVYTCKRSVKFETGDEAYGFFSTGFSEFSGNCGFTESSEGVLSLTTPAVSDYRYLGMGWYDIWFTATALSTSVTIQQTVGNYPSAATNASTAVQIEQASAPSSYIKTTTVAATRNADDLGIDATGKINTQQGSFLISSVYPVDNNNIQMLLASGPSASNEFRMECFTTNFRVTVDTGAGDIITNVGPRVAGGEMKALLSYEKTSSGYDWKCYLNGADAVTFTTTDLPTLTNIKIGQRANGLNGLYAWGEAVGRFQYYTNAIPSVLAKSWTGV